MKRPSQAAYQKQRRDAAPSHRDVEAMPNPPLDRIMASVLRGIGDDHWMWLGAKNADGYGVLSYCYRTHLVHRLTYSWLVSPIPDGLQIDHLCRVRDCVNPAHMEPVTLQVNNARGESVSSQHARKIMCINGHPYDEANTYQRPSGGRSCRACGCETARRVRQRRAMHDARVKAAQ